MLYHFSPELVDGILKIFLGAHCQEEALQNSLGYLADAFHIENISLYEGSPDNARKRCTWNGSNQPFVLDLGESCGTMIAYSYSMYTDGLFINIPDIATTDRELPEEFLVRLRERGIRSLLHVALCFDGEPAGFIGIHGAGTGQEWTTDDIEAIASLGRLIFAATRREPSCTQNQEQTILNILETIPMSAFIVDISDFHILFSNERTKTLHVSQEKNGTCHSLFYNSDVPCDFCPVLQYRQGDECAETLSDVYHSGSKCWYTSHSSIFEWGDGRKVCFAVFIPRQNNSATPVTKLEALAYTDELTGIPNNRKFETDGPDLLEQSEMKGRPVAMMALKVGGLHHVNSLRGYALGDSVMKAMAEAIGSILPLSVLFARRRGNDFSILYPLASSDPISEVSILLKRMMRTMTIATPISVRGWFKLFVGVSLFPDHGRTFEALDRKARQAVTMCEDSGQIMIARFYNVSLMSKLREREQLKLDLGVALRRSEMELLYQPKYDLHTERIEGAEALIRWNHPVHGRVGADIFIPIAEEALSIPVIDNWVINETCRQWNELQNMGCRMIPVSINVSPQKFYQPDLLELLSQAVTRYDLDPNLLEVELTERSALEDISKAILIMQNIRERGFRVSIDDFGTGYSSLNYLRSLPFDVVKLDRCFIQDIGTSDKAREVLQAIVSLIKVYDATVVFEGIETLEQFNFARRANCDLIQGYYTGRPMSAAALAELLMKN